MNAPARIEKAGYPGKVAIRHAVEAAKACGIDVAGLEVSPDGTIRIMEARAVPTKPESLYDKLKREGQL
jgi:hypothetical protein